MKAYTDLEQSKKLAEILSIESADMHYATWTILDGEFIVSPNQGSTIENLREDYGNQIIPCWSLAALLDVLPKNLDIGRPILATNYKGYYWVSYFDEYMKEKFTSKIYNNPIDACYGMILKLNKQNIL